MQNIFIPIRLLKLSNDDPAFFHCQFMVLLMYPLI